MVIAPAAMADYNFASVFKSLTVRPDGRPRSATTLVALYAGPYASTTRVLLLKGGLFAHKSRNAGLYNLEPNGNKKNCNKSKGYGEMHCRRAMLMHVMMHVSLSVASDCRSISAPPAAELARGDDANRTKDCQNAMT